MDLEVVVGEHGSSRQEPAERNIATLAARQHGVFTRRQAIAAGMTNGVIARRLQDGTWHQMHSSVYRVAGAPLSERAILLGACLAWGHGAVVSHRAAARLWQFVGFRSSPELVELTVPRKRVRKVPGHVIHRPRSLPDHDVTRLDGVPITAPARTLLDVAAFTPIEAMQEALDDALRRKLVTIPWLTWLVHQSAASGRAGISSMRTLLGLPGAGVPESVFERRLLRAVVNAGLPAPIPQYEVRAEGRLVARVDLAYPARRLAIEAAGFRWHSLRSDVERDAQRQSALAALGWRVIRITWSQLHDRPDHVTHVIREALRG